MLHSLGTSNDSMTWMAGFHSAKTAPSNTSQRPSNCDLRCASGNASNDRAYAVFAKYLLSLIVALMNTRLVPVAGSTTSLDEPSFGMPQRDFTQPWPTPPGVQAALTSNRKPL